jgi:hypothetical protein
LSLPVWTTPEADTEIREIDDWWRKNRRSSPDLFLDELASSLRLSRSRSQQRSLKGSQ